MTQITVRIPSAIDPALTGNSRSHPMKKYRLAAELRDTAYLACRVAIPFYDLDDFVERARLPLTLDWIVARGKHKKPLDDDNIKAGLKGACDGIALAIGVNDKHFVIGTVEQIRDPDGIGFVEVTITPAPGDDQAGDWDRVQ